MIVCEILTDFLVNSMKANKIFSVVKNNILFLLSVRRAYHNRWVGFYLFKSFDWWPLAKWQILTFSYTIRAPWDWQVTLQEPNDDNIISSDGMPFRDSRIIPRDFAAQYRIKSRAKHGKYWAGKRLHRLQWRYARRRLYWLHRDLIVNLNLDSALNKNDSLAPSLLTYKICCTTFTMINLAAWNR